MTESGVPEANVGGPYVTIASLCERVIEERDGTLTLVRVIDRWIHMVQQVDGTDDMPPLTTTLWIALSLKPDRARGRHTLSVEIEDPSGSRSAVFAATVTFAVADGGANLVAGFTKTYEHEGLYWFDIRLDMQERPLSRIPFRVIYSPSPAAAQ